MPHMRISDEILKNSNFLGITDIQKGSTYLHRTIFLEKLRTLGIRVRRFTDHGVEIFDFDIDDVNVIFKLLYPQSKWNYYIQVLYDKYIPTLDYLHEHHADGSMSIFDSGSVYAAFETEAAAMLYKLTME